MQFTSETSTQETSGEAVLSEVSDTSAVTSAKAMRRQSRKSIAGLVTSVGSAAPKEFLDPTLLESWFELDSNAVPPMYKLKRVRSELKMYNCHLECIVFDD